VTAGPALVSILRQGSYLIASIHTALDDAQLVRFQQDLVDQIGVYRCRGVIIDVAALDVLDSFGARTLRDIAEMARLRGALTVVVGIQPDVAFTMVELGMGAGSVPTELDLEEGLAYLDRRLGRANGSASGSSNGSLDGSAGRSRDGSGGRSRDGSGGGSSDGSSNGWRTGAGRTVGTGSRDARADGGGRR
jgi:rsbT antagonist protein RsbS